MKQIGAREWLIVAVIAVVVHVVFLVRFQVETTLPAPNSGNGVQRTRIALAPKQDRPKQEENSPDTDAANDSNEDQDDSVTAEKTEPEPAPQPESAPQTEPQHEQDTEPKPEPEKDAEPVAKSTTPTKPERKSRSGNETKDKPEEEPEPRSDTQSEDDAESTLQPQHEQTPSSDSAESEDVSPQAEDASADSASDQASANARAEQTSDTTQQEQTAGLADTPASYRNKLGAALQRHKNYPRRARRRNKEGTVTLHFVMDRRGHVVDWDIRESSGHKVLDDAVRKMLKQADPLPPLPDNTPMQRLALTVPIAFKLH